MTRLILATLMAVMIVTPQIRAQQSSPALEKLFASAQHKATVDGDLKGAIDDYKRIVSTAGKDRGAAARALLRMAEAYQKLGDSEAQRIYAELLRDYREYADIVAQARARMSVNTPERARGDRIVKSGPNTTWGDGRVSPDGRLISYVDYAVGTLDYKLHDLVTGVDRPLQGCAYTSAFAPDGKRVVCGGFGKVGIRIVAVDGSSPPRVVHANTDVDIFYPSDWSSDGKSIALVARRLDRTHQIGVLNLEDSSFRVLKTVGWRGPNKMFFSPDGKYMAYDLPASETDTQRDVFIIAVDGSADRRVTEHAADDAVMAWAGDGRHLLFASNRNGPVGLWVQPVVGGATASAAPTLVKTDIGTVDSQGLTAAGTLYVVKNASTLHMQIAPIDLAAGRLSGASSLRIYGSDTPAWSLDGRQLAYAMTPANGLRYLAIHDLVSNTVRELRPQLLYMPMPQWFPDGKSVVVWGRDLQGQGVIKRIDVETGRDSFITTAWNIQSVRVSSDGTKIYYADQRGSRPGRIIERDLATGSERDFAAAGAVSPDGRWGAIIRFDAKSKSSTVTFTPLGGGEPHSVVAPVELAGFRALTWTPDSRAILSAESGKALWVVPVDGRSPRKLDIDISSWIDGQGIRLSPDGKSIAFFTGQDAREVWALENVVPAGSRPASRQ